MAFDQYEQKCESRVCRSGCDVGHEEKKRKVGQDIFKRDGTNGKVGPGWNNGLERLGRLPHGQPHAFALPCRSVI
jgi:hypothetical protein